MSDVTSPREMGRLSTLRLILVPAAITLAVTILRLVGELRHWSKVLFNAAPVGPGSLVSIVWLVPIFGVYFALRLTKAGETAPRRWRPLGYALLGLLLAVVSEFLIRAQFTPPAKVLLAYLIMVVGALVSLAGWPALGKTLLAYAYAARLPVAVIMFFASRGNWGTDYDVLRPGIRTLGFWMTYVQFGLLPQLVLRVGFTVVVGSLLGGIVNAWVQRREPAPAAGA